MKFSKKQFVLLLILSLLIVCAGLAYYWYLNIPKNTNGVLTKNDINKRNTSTLKGLFYQFDYDPVQRARVNIFAYDFLNSKKEQILTFDSFYAPDIVSKNNLIAYTRVLDDINCVEGFLGQLKCKNELKILELSSGQEISIATNVITFTFSSDTRYIFYAIYDKQKNESEIYRYDVSNGVHDIALDNWKGVIELALGSNKDGLLIFAQKGKLYAAKDKKAELLYDSIIENNRELLAHYNLSIDGSRILITKGTRFGEEEIGLYDLTARNYQKFDLRSFKMDGDYNYTLSENGENILIDTHEGRGKYSYSIFDWVNAERKKVFETDTGLIIRRVPAKDDFLVRKGEFIDRRGVVSFFIEPSMNQNRLVIQSSKVDGNEPNVYFLDWIN